MSRYRFLYAGLQGVSPIILPLHSTLIPPYPPYSLEPVHFFMCMTTRYSVSINASNSATTPKTMTTHSSSSAEDIVHAPHPPLTEYYEREEDRRDWVGAHFDKTASDYDRMERILGLGTGSIYRRKTLERAGLRPGMQMLDVGMGTGLGYQAGCSYFGRREQGHRRRPQRGNDPQRKIAGRRDCD